MSETKDTRLNSQHAGKSLQQHHMCNKQQTKLQSENRVTPWPPPRRWATPRKCKPAKPRAAAYATHGRETVPMRGCKVEYCVGISNLQHRNTRTKAQVFTETSWAQHAHTLPRPSESTYCPCLPTGHANRQGTQMLVHSQPHMRSWVLPQSAAVWLLIQNTPHSGSALQRLTRRVVTPAHVLPLLLDPTLYAPPSCTLVETRPMHAPGAVLAHMHDVRVALSACMTRCGMLRT